MARFEPIQWLYFNARGDLVITRNPRDDLKPLLNARGFSIHAPLDGCMTVDVELSVGELDIVIPKEQVRFIARRRNAIRRAIAKLWSMLNRRALVTIGQP